MSFFHKRAISCKGTLGDLSKIREELEEVEEALEQGDKMLVLVEIVDLLGAIHLFLLKEYGPIMGLPQMVNFTMNMVKFRKHLDESK